MGRRVEMEGRICGGAIGHVAGFVDIPVTKPCWLLTLSCDVSPTYDYTR